MNVSFIHYDILNMHCCSYVNVIIVKETDISK